MTFFGVTMMVSIQRKFFVTAATGLALMMSLGSSSVYATTGPQHVCQPGDSIYPGCVIVVSPAPPPVVGTFTPPALPTAPIVVHDGEGHAVTVRVDQTVAAHEVHKLLFAPDLSTVSKLEAAIGAVIVVTSTQGSVAPPPEVNPLRPEGDLHNPVALSQDSTGHRTMAVGDAVMVSALIGLPNSIVPTMSVMPNGSAVQIMARTDATGRAVFHVCVNDPVIRVNGSNPISTNYGTTKLRFTSFVDGAPRNFILAINITVPQPPHPATGLVSFRMNHYSYALAWHAPAGIGAYRSVSYIVTSSNGGHCQTTGLHCVMSGFRSRSNYRFVVSVLSSSGTSHPAGFDRRGGVGPYETLGHHDSVPAGHEGAYVALIQKILKIKVTGYYSRATQAAVKNFQFHQGLKVTGSVDALTWLSLN